MKLTRPKNRKRLEFSKILVLVVIAFFGIIVDVYAMILMWSTQTTDGLEWLIGTSATEVTAVIAFYLNKAKLENALKYNKIDPKGYRAVKKEDSDES